MFTLLNKREDNGATVKLFYSEVLDNYTIVISSLLRKDATAKNFTSSELREHGEDFIQKELGKIERAIQKEEEKKARERHYWFQDI